MNKTMRSVLVGLTLNALSTLIAPSMANAQESVAATPSTTLPEADVIELQPDGVTAIIASRGSLIRQRQAT